MYELWEFLRKNAKKIVIFGGIILLCLFIGFMFGGRENVSSNGVSINDVRTELSNAQDAKSDIADTVGNLANSIDTATGASKHFDAIIDECTGIIEQIRKQPAE